MKNKTLIKNSKFFLKNNNEFKKYKSKLISSKMYFLIEKIISILGMPINQDFLNNFNIYLANNNELDLLSFRTKIVACFKKIDEEKSKMLNHFFSYLWYSLNKFYFLKFTNKNFSLINPYKEKIFYEIDIIKRNEYFCFIDIFKKNEHFNIKLKSILRLIKFLLKY